MIAFDYDISVTNYIEAGVGQYELFLEFCYFFARLYWLIIIEYRFTQSITYDGWRKLCLRNTTRVRNASKGMISFML